jgi:hypothetical protein
MVNNQSYSNSDSDSGSGSDSWGNELCQQKRTLSASAAKKSLLKTNLEGLVGAVMIRRVSKTIIITCSYEL